MPFKQRDRTSILTATIARMTRVRFDQRARALGLTRPQWQTLNCIIFCEGATLTQIAEIIETEAITASRLADGLEAMGLVERRLDASDRRVRLIHLTPAAHPMIRQMRVLSDETEAELYAGVSSDDMDSLERILTAVHGNLSKSLNKAGPRAGAALQRVARQSHQANDTPKRRTAR